MVQVDAERSLTVVEVLASVGVARVGLSKVVRSS